jgi:hypothetical protein
MSSARPRVPAYVALARSIFEHYLFNGQRNRPYSWREAWEWLFTNAAWRPQGKRMSRGIAAIKRGQIAITIRGLASTWNWSRGSVEYFLRRLKEEGMIESAAAKTKIQTSSEARKSYAATILTVCNYDKFQKMSASAVGQSLRQVDSSSAPELPGFTREIGIEQPNHFTIDSSKHKTGPHLHKPHHQATSKDRRWIWCDYGSDDWTTYNADFNGVSGADILPERRIEGRGNWFYKAGEGMRPKKHRRRA